METSEGGNAMDMDRVLEVVAEQEKELTFSSFSVEDAWKLGTLLKEEIEKEHADALIAIVSGGLPIFACGVGNPCHNNQRWMERKRRTVLEFGHSSYFVSLTMQMKKKSLEDKGLDPLEYVLAGGGFPLIVGGTLSGVITVSGMPQTHDHQTIVNAMASFLQKSVPSILPLVDA